MAAVYASPAEAELFMRALKFLKEKSIPGIEVKVTLREDSIVLGSAPGTLTGGEEHQH